LEVSKYITQPFLEYKSNVTYVLGMLPSMHVTFFYQKTFPKYSWFFFFNFIGRRHFKFHSGLQQTKRCIDLIHETTSCIYYEEENLQT